MSKEKVLISELDEFSHIYNYLEEKSMYKYGMEYSIPVLFIIMQIKPKWKQPCAAILNEEISKHYLWKLISTLSANTAWNVSEICKRN